MVYNEPFVCILHWLWCILNFSYAFYIVVLGCGVWCTLNFSYAFYIVVLAHEMNSQVLFLSMTGLPHYASIFEA